MTFITIKNISKKYIINPYRNGDMQKSFREEIKNIFHIVTPYLKKIKKDQESFWALQNIDISFRKGDIVGIIGSNGAGKSTLLKILAGIIPPTHGKVLIEGKVSSLLGIGVGFHSELSGRDNIYLNGALMGFKKKDIQREFDNIVSFSGVEKFIDTPVKFYSSGMFVRLAFSVATAAYNTPDIFLIDEVLAVGDQEFKEKSLYRIKQLTQSKKSIILLVSHDLALIEDICKKCLWLDKGKIKAFGKPKDVIATYRINNV